MKYVIAVLIAVLAAVIMTVLSAVPPVSILYNWLDANNLSIVWIGIMAAIVATCTTLYINRTKNKKK